MSCLRVKLVILRSRTTAQAGGNAKQVVCRKVVSRPKKFGYYIEHYVSLKISARVMIKYTLEEAQKRGIWRQETKKMRAHDVTKQEEVRAGLKLEGGCCCHQQAEERKVFCCFSLF